jgi:hypothetical protein
MVDQTAAALLALVVAEPLPALSVTASRTPLAIACGLKWERLCYDISTAYFAA